MDNIDLERRIADWRGGNTSVEVIGFSRLARPIYAVHVGDDSPRQQIWTAAIHAREHLTADALCAMIDWTLSQADNLQGGVWFIPLVNPDGAALCLHGLGEREFGVVDYLTEINGGSGDFSLWKASANAVDLNCNFPAAWAHGVGNSFVPSPSAYVGQCPLSEPETKALAQFTARVAPYFTGSLHAKGREVYWEFDQNEHRKVRDRRVAEHIAQTTGYRLIDGTLGSAGGYKDYCVTAFCIPSVTIEMFDDELTHPLPSSEAERESKRVEQLAVAMSNFSLVP